MFLINMQIFKSHRFLTSFESTCSLQWPFYFTIKIEFIFLNFFFSTSTFFYILPVAFSSALLRGRNISCSVTLTELKPNSESLLKRLQQFPHRVQVKVNKALCLAFKTCHDLVQTNFASFSPHSVSSFNCSCKWNQFSMPCLTYSLPCLMLFLLNIMFLSLMCNDF